MASSVSPFLCMKKNDCQHHAYFGNIYFSLYAAAVWKKVVDNDIWEV